MVTIFSTDRWGALGVPLPDQYLEGWTWLASVPDRGTHTAMWDRDGERVGYDSPQCVGRKAHIDNIPVWTDRTAVLTALAHSPKQRDLVVIEVETGQVIAGTWPVSPKWGDAVETLVGVLFWHKTGRVGGLVKRQQGGYVLVTPRYKNEAVDDRAVEIAPDRYRVWGEGETPWQALGEVPLQDLTGKKPCHLCGKWKREVQLVEIPGYRPTPLCPECLGHQAAGG